MILHAPIITQRDLNLDLLELPTDPQWVRLDRIEFGALYERDMQETDTAWVLGKLPIRGGRVALLVLTRTVECDQPVRFVTLHLFEGCSSMAPSFFVVENDDHGGVYERICGFTSNNDTLVLSVREGEAGAEGVDTVFTRSDWIRLAPTIDTVRTETAFEVAP